MSRYYAAPPRAAAARWKWAVLLAAGSLLCAILVLTCAAARRPAWYAPRALDRLRLQDDKRELVSLADEISRALHEHQRYELHLDQDQLNRWIVARDEIWPELATRYPVTPQWCERPQVELLPASRLRLSGLVAWRGLRGVVSLTCRLEATPERLGLVWESLRLGSLPLPRRWVSRLLHDALAGRDSHARLQGDGSLWVDNDWIWRNGKQPFRLVNLILARGQAQVTIEPLP